MRLKKIQSRNNAFASCRAAWCPSDCLPNKLVQGIEQSKRLVLLKIVSVAIKSLLSRGLKEPQLTILLEIKSFHPWADRQSARVSYASVNLRSSLNNFCEMVLCFLCLFVANPVCISASSFPLPAPMHQCRRAARARFEDRAP